MNSSSYLEALAKSEAVILSFGFVARSLKSPISKAITMQMSSMVCSLATAQSDILGIGRVTMSCGMPDSNLHATFASSRRPQEALLLDVISP